MSVVGKTENMRTIRVEREVQDAAYFRTVLEREHPPSLQEKMVMNNAVREAIREAMVDGYFSILEEGVSLEDSEVVVVVKNFTVRLTGLFREEI